MLQQTQVATVLPYFERWLQAFPDVGRLAHAREEQVLRLWEGLGYYSRARNLRQAAKEVVRRFDGTVPRDPGDFRSLPGVGDYTCAAVMSIAFDHDLPVLDGNVKRVLCRLLALEQTPSRPPASHRLSNLVRRLLPAGTAALHNQAMMELGALVCKPRTPDCEACPMARPCRARAEGEPLRYPVKRPKTKVPHRRFAVGLLVRKNKVLIDRRPPAGLLGGLWEFPRVELRDGESERQTLAKGLLHLARVRPGCALDEVSHAYSHFRVTLHPWLCSAEAPAKDRAAEGQPIRWVSLDKLANFPMSTADRKVMRLLLDSISSDY